MNLPSNIERPAATRRVADNIFFPLLIACGGMFCLTSLILVIAAFDTTGDPKIAFFEEYAPWMIFIEMGVTVVVGFLALLFDRRRTLAAMAETRSLDTEHDATPTAQPAKDGH